MSGVEPRAYLHLTVVRALRAMPPVLPHDVTPAMLVDACAMDQARATAALQRARTSTPDLR